MCNFLSKTPRAITLRAGGQRNYQGCFLEHAGEKDQKAWAAKKLCLFHEGGEPVLLARAGAGAVSEYDERLSTYIMGQRARYTTLDLCGLYSKYRNGSSPFRLLKDLEDEATGFSQIILDESVLYCEVSISDVCDPALEIAISCSHFYGEMQIGRVKCHSLVLSDTRFEQKSLEISGLICRKLDLSRCNLSTLKITDSTIELLDLTDANIDELEILSSQLGKPSIGLDTTLPRGLLFSSSLRDLYPVRRLSIVGGSVSGQVNLRGRLITGAYTMDGVALSAPVEISRNVLTGQINIHNNTYTHTTSNDQTRKSWIRYFVELKAEGLKSGDAVLWKNAAIWEQETRLARSNDLIHKAAFQIDGWVSDHGTNVSTAVSWLLLQVVFFTAVYAICDAVSGRIASYVSFWQFWSSKASFAVAQTVQPFSAFSVDFMGHPYAAHEGSGWLDSLTLLAASLQSAACVMIFASVILALRHRITSSA